MKPENYKYHLVIRLKGYNYSSPGIYFVTVCATNRCDFFTRVMDGNSLLNGIGAIADSCWKAIPIHFKHATLMDYIVMPDHLHGLIRLHALELGDDRKELKERELKEKESGMGESDNKGTACRALSNHAN